MFPELKKMRVGVRMRLRQVHKVTQWKSGCVYRTKPIGYIVCEPDYKLLDTSNNIQIGSVSTKVSRELM